MSFALHEQLWEADPAMPAVVRRSPSWSNLSGLGEPDGKGCYPADGDDLELGKGSAAGVNWTEQVRHLFLLLRLKRAYLVYTLCCTTLATAAFVSTLASLLDPLKNGDRAWEDVLEGSTWQNFCWSVVALSLIVELTFGIFAQKRNENRWDFWVVFDALVLVLTALAWVLPYLRRASQMREEAEEMDLWLLALRFALQPFRVFAAVKMARKVHNMQESHEDINFDALSLEESTLCPSILPKDDASFTELPR
mmetsp:Transcript_5223/g.10833  ORF Transcript_5223/g.10833 Transcript_5223/m.10833 type:complete len:251 (+) Transcript_5223:113-865(+)